MPQTTGTNGAASLRTDSMHALAQRRLQLVLGDGLAAEVLLEQLVVGLAGLLDQLLVIGLGLVEHVGRDVLDVVVGAHGLVLVDERLHPHQVDDAAELVLGADRQLDGDRVALQLRLDLRQRLLKSAPMRSILLTKQMRGTR